MSKDVQTQLEQVGHAAGELKDDVLATAATAAATAKEKTLDVYEELAAQLPKTPEELGEAVAQIAEKIRRNPTPWIVGGAVVFLAWALGRGRRN